MLLLSLWLTGCKVPAPVPASAPPIGSGASVHVLMVGDIGSDTTDRRRVLEGMRARCAERRCDAVVLLGDLIYPRGPTSPDDPRLDDWIGAYTALAPVYLALGNHDYGHGRDDLAVDHLLAWAAARPDVHLPSPLYTASLGDGLGTLAVIDTNHIFQYGDTRLGAAESGDAFPSQGAWLDHLAAGPGPLVVAGHHPFRSNGPHGNAGRYEGWRNLPWASGRSLQAFFEAHIGPQALMYANGHDHNLQLLPCGRTTCAVAGSGAKTRELVDRGNTPHFAASIPGFVALELSTDGADAVACDARGQEVARVSLQPLERSP